MENYLAIKRMRSHLCANIVGTYTSKINFDKKEYYHVFCALVENMRSVLEKNVMESWSLRRGDMEKSPKRTTKTQVE